MKAPVHAAVSAALSAAVYAATGSESAAWAALLSGVFIDLDHVADFLVLSGEKFSVAGFFSWCEELRWQRIFLLLHSVELLALLGLLAWWRHSAVLAGVLLGAGSHLALDQVGNRTLKGHKRSDWFYFLCFRYRAGFRKARMLRG